MKITPDMQPIQDGLRTPLRIALFYGHVASNIGDLAINVGTLQLIADRFPGAVVDVVLLDAANSPHLAFSTSSFDSPLPVALHHLTANPLRGFDYLADPALFLRDCGLDVMPDVILLAAGEHLFDYGNGENAKSLFWRVLPAYVGASLGLRVVQMPATFGPFETVASRDLMAAFLGVCTAWSVRDAASGRYLAGLYPQMKPALNLDPAFMIDSPLKDIEAKARSAPVTAIAMRSDGWGIRLDREKRSEMTADFRADGHASSRAYQITETVLRGLLLTAKAEVVIFVQTVADKLLAQRLMALATDLGAEKRVSMVTPKNVGDYLAQLAHADRVITSRFHAVILAMVKGTPAFGLYFTDHGHKMPGLFDMLGLPAFCTNGSEGDTGDLAREILASLRQGRAKTKGAVGRLEKLRNQTGAWFEAALSNGHAGTVPAPEGLCGSLTELALLLASPAIRTENKTPTPSPLDSAGAAALLAGAKAARVILFTSDGPGVDLAASLPGKLVFVTLPDLAQARARRAEFAARPRASGVVVHHCAGSGPDLWAQPWFRIPDLVVMDDLSSMQEVPLNIQGLGMALQSGARIEILAGPGALVQLGPLVARHSPTQHKSGSLTGLHFAGSALPPAF